MLCAFCRIAISKPFAWDETSHLGKRPLCRKCVSERELASIRNKKYGNLYLENGKLVNATKSLSLKITLSHKFPYGQRLSFNFDNEKWYGIYYSGSNRVLCRKETECSD